MAALARRQERELRAWLNASRPVGTFAAALDAAAAEVEGDHHVPIEVVTVGDAPLDERAAALVAATREALVNASKFAGPEPIALYAEVEDGRFEVFVRDRGPGFDARGGPIGPARGARLYRGPHGAPRRHRDRPLAARPGHRGRAGAGMTGVVIVDDHSLFRAGVRAELDGLVDVLGDAATVEDAVRLIAELEPDVVLLDVHMPGGGGLEVIRQSAAAQRFLALSVSDAPEDVIAVIRAGARGYVTKTISGDGAGRRDPPRGRRRRRLLAAAGRVRARRVRLPGARRRSTRSSTS